MLTRSAPSFAMILTLCTLAGTATLAQDVVYFSNDGSSVADTRIMDIPDTEAILSVGRRGSLRDVTLSRSRIALAFTKAGNFLLISELASDAAQAKTQLRAFLDAPVRPATHDFLIKTSPFKVIPARIAYENEEVVNYTTPNGNAAAIRKSDLAAILYHDGRHQLTAPVVDAAPLLAKARETLSDTSFTATPPVDVLPPDEQRDSLTAPTPTPDTPTPVTDAAGPPGSMTTLSAEQKELYQQQSLARVDEFVSYLSVITDQSVDSELRDKAIESASRLFLPESTIEVTSTRQPGARRYSVRLYLTRLKLLPYLSARIDWVQTQFVHNLTPNLDGTYSGVVMGQQTFSGYGANGQPTYSDLTPKYVRVRLNHAEPSRWRVMLGTIRVAAD